MGVAALGRPTRVLMALIVLPPALSAQSLPVDDPMSDYARLLQIAGLSGAGSVSIRPFSAAAPILADVTEEHPWAGRFETDEVTDGSFRWTAGDSRIRLFANTRFPRGANDGAVWQGRGLTSAVETSGSIRWRGLSVRLNPVVLFTQNADFPLAPVQVSGQPDVAYPWRRIDWPQRFGRDSFWRLDAGQSQLTLDWGAARIGVGNENLWWGPGVRNALVLSNNAPGFLHTSLATNRPVDVGIGAVEAKWIWGGLAESKWFDPTAEDDRFITGIVVAYSPSFLPGLSVGATRVFQEYVPAGGLPFSEYFLVFQGFVKDSQISEGQPDGNDERDQLFSLFARWAFPESGAEVYGEWARTDHAQDLTDLVLEPEHSQAYTLGFRKITARTADRMFVLTAELTHLEASTTFQLRGRATYYVHSVVTQGYTHDGQILGAWVGPGGNSQFVALEVFDRLGSAAIFVQRQVHDNDAYWLWAEDTGSSFDNHDVSLDVGLRALAFWGGVEVGGGITFTRELNRYFFGPKLNNINVSLIARWRPGVG